MLTFALAAALTVAPAPAATLHAQPAVHAAWFATSMDMTKDPAFTEESHRGNETGGRH